MTTQTTPRLPFEIWALIAGSFAVAVGYGVVAPVLPQLASSFGVSITAASAIVSAFAAMRLVFAPAAGWFVNKWGERPTYTIGLLIVAASTGACAIAATYGQLLVLRAAGGIGSTMFSIAATGLLIRLAPVKMRGRISSYNAASFLLGGLLGPVLGGVVASFGLRAPFVFYFGMLLVAAALVGIALRRSTTLPS
ncbi:MAG: MFS transporter, partial [Agrococcus casei]